MDNTKNKEELLELIKKGQIDKFNKIRSYDQDILLDMSEIDLGGCDISKVNFSFADLSGADFSESELSGIDFSDSDLSSANFRGSNLRQAEFARTILEGTKFNGTSMHTCDFTEADLVGTDFSDADLTGADLAGSINIYQCKFNSHTIWPEEVNLPEDFEPIEEVGLEEDEDFYQDDFAY